MNINITAPLNELGYGQVSKGIVRAFDRAGDEPALWPIGQPDVPTEYHEVVRRCITRTQSYDRYAASLRIWHQFDLAQHVGKGIHVGLPIFELNQFRPVELHHLLQQDIVLVPSGWAKHILIDNGLKNVEIVPFGVDHDIFVPWVTPARDATTFINVGKWEIRKGHDVLLSAFCKAFAPKDDVRLIMVTSNPFLTTRETEQWTSYYKKSPLGDKIDVYPSRLPTQHDLAAVMAQADCGVFPSRAEGWGMESAEMLAMGKHIILTSYSAHTQYATCENSRQIFIDKLEPAYDGKWFHGDHGEWAHFGDAQMDQLVVHLREIHHDKQEGRLGMNLAGIETMRRHTWDATVADIKEAIRAYP